jgi:hypothetical protein
MKQAPDAPYLQNLAPLYFFLFSPVKRMLMGCYVDSLSKLLFHLGIISPRIAREELNPVFLDCIDRSQKDIDTNGKNIGWLTKSSKTTINFIRQILLCHTWDGTPYISSGESVMRLSMNQKEQIRPPMSKCCAKSGSNLGLNDLFESLYPVMKYASGFRGRNCT